MTSNGNLFLRNDTIFGVCEGLGQDLGINPNFLRVPLAAGIIFAPVQVIGVYAVLGLVVLATRFFFPDRRAVSAPAVEQPVHVVASAPVQTAPAVEQERVLEAA